MSCGLPGSWAEFEQALERYRDEANKPLAAFYREVFATWYRGMEHMEAVVLPWSREEMQNSFREGKHLLAAYKLPVKAALYKAILHDLLEAAARHFPHNASVQKMLVMKNMEEKEMASFLARVGAGDSEQLQAWLKESGWEETLGADAPLAAYMLSTALTPFYIAFARSVIRQVDFSLWPQGYCPVCGRKPLMAKLRAEDGARILECRLCHSQWQFPRLECPFCRNRDFNRLKFFYIDEMRGRRVQVCDCCKSYLKAAVVKEIGGDVILELENLFTVQLDFLARREGFRPGEELVLLS